MQKKSYISLNYLIYKSRAIHFAFRKLEFDMIYNAYSNESPFKYYISILGGGVGVGGLRPCLCYLFRGGGRIRENLLI